MALMRFPKSSRLLKRRDFLKVQAGSPVFHCKYFLLLQKENNLNNPRFGFTTSKKIGNAVCRNRARRLLKESIRLVEADIKALDYVFIAKRAIIEASFSDIHKEIERCFC